MNDILIEKLRKLLALGTSSNPHEAELAMQKAQEIALANDINLALVRDASEPENEEILKEYVQMGQRLPTVNNFVTNILIDYFNVRIITSGERRNGRSIVFIGTKDSIATARFVYNYLCDTMVRCWHVYYKNTPNVELSHKQSYCLGFYRGLSDKLAANRKTVESEKLTSDSDKNKWAIACVDLKAKMQDFIDSEFSNLRNAPKKSIQLNNQSYSSGLTDGKNCNIVKGVIN